MNISLLIVVPTLDSYPLLPRLLGSLQAQSWCNWRLLFVDGSSGRDHRHWLEDCCATEARCSWVKQEPYELGIFGAMNQGFAEAEPDEWVLFWGSDDLASCSDVFYRVIEALRFWLSSSNLPDLIVCRGRYVDSLTGKLGRPAVFRSESLLERDAYRSALFSGCTPPHQATLFGPGARSYLSRFSPGYRLSADLDYFLQLSCHPFLRVQCLDIELVHMGDGGVSGQQTRRRLYEVARAYRRSFACSWWFPFVSRYIRRLVTLTSRR